MIRNYDINRVRSGVRCQLQKVWRQKTVSRASLFVRSSLPRRIMVRNSSPMHTHTAHVGIKRLSLTTKFIAREINHVWRLRVNNTGRKKEKKRKSTLLNALKTASNLCYKA
jgi:hypothetical protein